MKFILETEKKKGNKMKFILEIEMGNDGVMDGYDVANLLVITANKIKHHNHRVTGKILDINGNTVGWYKFEEE